jgi:hypothetical protein
MPSLPNALMNTAVEKRSLVLNWYDTDTNTITLHVTQSLSYEHVSYLLQGARYSCQKRRPLDLA